MRKIDRTADAWIPDLGVTYLLPRQDAKIGSFLRLTRKIGGNSYLSRSDMKRLMNIQCPAHASTVLYATDDSMRALRNINDDADFSKRGLDRSKLQNGHGFELFRQIADVIADNIDASGGDGNLEVDSFIEANQHVFNISKYNDQITYFSANKNFDYKEIFRLLMISDIFKYLDDIQPTYKGKDISFDQYVDLRIMNQVRSDLNNYALSLDSFVSELISVRDEAVLENTIKFFPFRHTGDGTGLFNHGHTDSFITLNTGVILCPVEFGCAKEFYKRLFTSLDRFYLAGLRSFSSTKNHKMALPEMQSTRQECSTLNKNVFLLLLEDDCRLLNDVILIDGGGAVLPPEILEMSQSRVYNDCLRTIISSQDTRAKITYLARYKPHHKQGYSFRKVSVEFNTLHSLADQNKPVFNIHGKQLTRAEITEYRENWLRRFNIVMETIDRDWGRDAGLGRNNNLMHQALLDHELSQAEKRRLANLKTARMAPF